MTDADIRGWVSDAADMIREYIAYADAMRKIGRGFTPSSPYSPETLTIALDQIVSERTIDADLQSSNA